MSLKTILFVLAITFAPCFLLFGQKSSDRILKKMPQPQGVLYFLTAEKFDGVKSQASLFPDFTYLYQSEGSTDDSVTMNFSFISPSQNTTPRSLAVKNKNNELFLTMGIELFYLEKKGNKWKSRLSVKVPVEVFFTMLYEANTIEVVLATGTDEIVFKPCKKWKNMASIAGKILSAETGANH